MAKRLKQTKAARAARARYAKKKAAQGKGPVRKGRKRGGRGGKGRGRGKTQKGGFLGTLLSIGLPLIGELIAGAIKKH